MHAEIEFTYDERVPVVLHICEDVIPWKQVRYYKCTFKQVREIMNDEKITTVIPW